MRGIQEAPCSTKVFESLECFKNFIYDIDLKDNPQFKILVARRIPHAIRDEVKRELDRMVDLDVIEPVQEPTPAVSPIVIVKKAGKLRI